MSRGPHNTAGSFSFSLQCKVCWAVCRPPAELYHIAERQEKVAVYVWWVDTYLYLAGYIWYNSSYCIICIGAVQLIRRSQKHPPINEKWKVLTFHWNNLRYKLIIKITLVYYWFNRIFITFFLCFGPCLVPILFSALPPHNKNQKYFGEVESCRNRLTRS